MKSTTHARPTALQGGFLGADVFCALSGNLVTTRLLEIRSVAARAGLADILSFGAAMLSARYVERARPPRTGADSEAVPETVPAVSPMVSA